VGKDSSKEEESRPTYSPEASQIFGRERELLSGFLLPAEGERLRSLSALSRGDYGGAQQILSPAFNAARQAQAKLSAGVADLPANVAAPIQETQARQVRQIPFQLQSTAPDELGEISKSLLDPRFASLLAPGAQGTSQSGGSGLQTALTVVAALAQLGTQVYGATK
jgi:hypothetical protein